MRSASRTPGMVIHLGRRLPAASSDLPDDRRSGPLLDLPALSRGGLAILFGLAPDGVCPAIPVARNAVSSYLAISPLPGNGLAAIPWSPLTRTPPKSLPFEGGIFSVALSIPFPGLAVSQHPVLWCPDFPPEATGASRLLPATIQPTSRRFAGFNLIRVALPHGPGSAGEADYMGLGPMASVFLRRAWYCLSFFRAFSRATRRLPSPARHCLPRGVAV
ncbi:MAG: hypothetical protein JWP91_436 [Fibrobacteres bacterium]|nr:hypothetical protein [Fibrobacterota bacterium]